MHDLIHFGAVDPDSQIDGSREPLVSLCVTAHNYGRFLVACLDSILSQSYRNIECIVVDDASVDNTPEILALYAGRIVAVRHEAGQGQLAAMVAGFERSHGQFVTFVDADDFLYPDFVQLHVAAHLSPSVFVAMSTSLQHNVDADGRTHSTQPLLAHRRLLRIPSRATGQGLMRDTPLGDIPLTSFDPQSNYANQWLWGTTTSMMFRREAVELVLRPAPVGGNICADAYLAHFCHAIGGTAVVETPLSAYRRHGANGFADNVVVGGLSPIGTGFWQIGETMSMIAQQIVVNETALRRALGVRRYVITLSRFCSIRQALSSIGNLAHGNRALLTALFLTVRLVRHIRVLSYLAHRLVAIACLLETA